MPALIPAAAGASALGAGAAVGAGIGGAALGTGLAAGAALAGGAALPGILGGMGALGGAGATGAALGGAALTPAVASLAPAATAQAMGPTMLQASLPGITGGGVAPGAFGANLAGAATPGMTGGLASAYNPAMAQNLGAQFMAKSQAAGMPLAKPFGAETMLATNSANVAPTVIQQAPNLTGQMQAAQLKSAGSAALPADTSAMSGVMPGEGFMQNLGNLFQNPSMQGVKDYATEHPYATSAMAGLGAMGVTKMMQPSKVKTPESNAMIRPYEFDYNATGAAYEPGGSTSERMYFNPTYTAGEPYRADQKAEGGIASAYAVGGPVEQMAALNAVGSNTGYPMAGINTAMYANPLMQRPEATNVIAPSADAGVGAYSGEPRFAEGGEAKTEGGYKYSFDPQTLQFTQLSVPTIVPSRGVIGGAMGMGGVRYAAPTPQPVKNSGTKISGGIATPAVGPMQAQQAAPINIPAYQSPEQQLGLGEFYDYMNQQLAGYGGYGGFAKGGDVGGEAHLGDYSDGGRLLKGPGDGVSDSIPATIANKQPARLANNEFVIPARIVSEIGNGSTDAGARKLYQMMDRVQKLRGKTVGKNKVAVDSKAHKEVDKL